MKKYFISYSLKLANGNIGFNWAVMEYAKPITSAVDIKAMEQTILSHETPHGDVPVESVTIMSWQLMEGQVEEYLPPILPSPNPTPNF